MICICPYITCFSLSVKINLLRCLKVGEAKEMCKLMEKQLRRTRPVILMQGMNQLSAFQELMLMYPFIYVLFFLWLFISILAFGISLTPFVQIFQQLPYDSIIKTPPPDVQTNTGKLIHVERRAGDASAVAGASILASLSNLRQDLSRLKPTSQASGKNFKGSDLPSSPPINEDDLDGQEVNSATNLGSDAAADAGTASKSLPVDVNMDTGLEASNISAGIVTIIFDIDIDCNLKE